MAILFNFIIGFTAAFIGVIPPGLINMSAAKISMKEGRRNATLFSLGVCVTVMLQTYVALLFARYLEKKPRCYCIFRTSCPWNFYLYHYLLSFYCQRYP
jgi:threonine/homoserine/homoserine lactone efflux protein